MKIGIYGGTFDPPHIGHINAASEARRQLGLDRLIMIPAAIPPHKELQQNSAPGEHRLNMVRLASEYIGDVEVSDIELQRGGRSYTVDTVSVIKEENPDDEIYLLIGTDMLAIFEQWYRFEDILATCTLAVFQREEDDRELIEKTAVEFREKYGARIEVIYNKAISISSTTLRKSLSQRGGIEYLPEKVYEYILKNRLYGAKANFDYLRTRAYAMLKPGRIAHVAGCEYEAVRLAGRWGVSEDDAREAAILHDITKKLDLEEQLILCSKYDIITDTAEKNDAKLLHSKTGAAVAKDLFGVSEDIYDAIFWHTTGKADMSILEKIIYLADYIEPTRDFEGLEKLREAAYTDLDGALILGLEMSLEDLKERNIVPHSRTKEAINWLYANVRGRD